MNICDYTNDTPLYYALREEKWECVNALLENEKQHVDLNVMKELKFIKDRKNLALAGE